jgi:ABC-2 type transport system permease protein
MLLGIVLWTFFSEVTNNGLASVVSRGDVIRKINFPKYIIVISGSLSAVINLAINLCVVLVLMVINGVQVHLTMLMLPIFVFELFIFGLGIAFTLSAIYVKYRDIQYMWEIFMQALFYGSAVIYPISMVISQSESIAKILMLNPVAQTIQDARHFFVNEANPHTFDILANNPIYYAAPFFLAISVLVLGALMFKKKSPYFAENV